MAEGVSLTDIIVVSDDVVAREIEGELIIIPLIAGIGDLEDDLYTLNETGREIWKNLDGGKNLKEIADKLGEKFSSVPDDRIEKDIIGLMNELLKRRMVKRITDNV